MSPRVPVGIDLDAAAPAVRWLPSDGARFTEPFFDDTVRRLRARGTDGRATLTTPLAAWDAPPPSSAPAGIVFHVSRCGSTLLTQMLAALPRHLVVSEAQVFDDILRRRPDDPALDADRRCRWLQHAAAAFVASQSSPPSALFVKLDCWHIFALDLVRRAFPHTPLLFVYRTPIEVLASLMARPSWTLVRDVVRPEELGVSRAERDAMTTEEHAAAILGAFYREAARHRADLTPIAYDALPARVWGGLPGVMCSPEEIAVMKAVAERDAKSPSRPFVPDGTRKRGAASAALARAAARWAEPAYARWLAVC